MAMPRRTGQMGMPDKAGKHRLCERYDAITIRCSKSEAPIALGHSREVAIFTKKGDGNGDS